MKKRTRKKDPNVYPTGFDRKRVEAVIKYYDAQTEKEAITEADAAWVNARFSLVRVPNELLDDVNELIEQHAAHKRRAKPQTRRKSA